MRGGVDNLLITLPVDNSGMRIGHCPVFMPALLQGKGIVMKINKIYIMFPVYVAGYKAGRKSLNDIARRLGRQLAISAYKDTHRKGYCLRYWSRSLSRWISSEM